MSWSETKHRSFRKNIKIKTIHFCFTDKLRGSVIKWSTNHEFDDIERRGTGLESGDGNLKATAKGGFPWFTAFGRQWHRNVAGSSVQRYYPSHTSPPLSPGPEESNKWREQVKWSERQLKHRPPFNLYCYYQWWHIHTFFILFFWCLLFKLFIFHKFILFFKISLNKNTIILKIICSLFLT